MRSQLLCVTLIGFRADCLSPRIICLDILRSFFLSKGPPMKNVRLRSPCVKVLGVSYNLVVQYVNEGLSDGAILQSCFGMGHRPSEAEIYMWNEFMLKRGWHDDASQTLKQLKREEGLTARSEIETIFQLIDVAEWRAPHTNHYDGSCLDQISSIVGGRRHQPSPQLARLNGFLYRAAN